MFRIKYFIISQNGKNGQVAYSEQYRIGYVLPEHFCAPSATSRRQESNNPVFEKY